MTVVALFPPRAVFQPAEGVTKPEAGTTATVPATARRPAVPTASMVGVSLSVKVFLRRKENKSLCPRLKRKKANVKVPPNDITAYGGSWFRKFQDKSEPNRSPPAEEEEEEETPKASEVGRRRNSVGMGGGGGEW